MIRDIRGKSLELSEPPRRVVSLVPSLTETLFDIGAGESVVGATDYCIFPKDLDCARVGGTKNPDIDAIRALSPALVYVNLEENLKRHAEAIEQFAPLFATEPKSVAGVAALITTLGAIHGRDDPAATKVAALRHEVDQMPRRSFTFACAIWKKPWMWCGGDTYVANLIEAAGGRNVISELRYPSLALEEIVARAPDIFFLPDEPYPFTESDAEEIRSCRGAPVSSPAQIRRRPTRVIGPFPGHLFTWHGTRTIEGLRFLRSALE